jgi:hypothetical protein
MSRKISKTQTIGENMTFKDYFKRRIMESLVREETTTNPPPTPNPLAPENFGPDYPFDPYYNPFGYDPNEWTPPKPPAPPKPTVVEPYSSPNTRERNQRRGPADYRD